MNSSFGYIACALTVRVYHPRPSPLVSVLLLPCLTRSQFFHSAVHYLVIRSINRYQYNLDRLASVPIVCSLTGVIDVYGMYQVAILSYK